MADSSSVIALLAVLGLGVAAWIATRRRRSGAQLRIDPDEMALITRAADGDEGAARELSRRGEAASAALRLRAESDRAAALQYREELAQKLSILEPLAAQLNSMDLPEAKRREVQQRVSLQHAEASRELEWVEGQLRLLSK
jgi:hypothetical protein